jgi:AcrR family transcriptional regulator
MELILAAAARQFAQFGYRRTTLKSVAAEAGVTDAGLMHHFPSKAHLFSAVGRRRFERVGRLWEAVADDASFCQVLAVFWRLTRAAQADDGTVVLAVLSAATGVSPESPIHADYAAAVAAGLADITRRFQGCLDRGELAPDADPEGLARECLALGNGLEAQWILAGRSFDLAEQLLDGLARLACSALADRPDPATARAAIRQAGEALGETVPT